VYCLAKGASLLFESLRRNIRAPKVEKFLVSCILAAMALLVKLPLQIGLFNSKVWYQAVQKFGA